MVAKNFKFLYRYYQDKQEVLARLFGVPQSTISAYANGKMPIPIGVLHAIARRYNISTDDLINKDLSLEFDCPQMIDQLDLTIVGQNALPLLTSDVAKHNESFSYAYKLCKNSLKTDDIYDPYKSIPSLDHAIYLFQKAWAESNTYVALANSISIILYINYIYNNNFKIQEIAKVLSSNEKIDLLTLRSALLKDPRKDTEHNPYTHQQRDFYNKYKDTVYRNIKLLKSNSYFYELGDFYLAMCNFFSFTDKEIEPEHSTLAGMCMLIQLCELDNKYAWKLTESLFPFIVNPDIFSA